MIAHEMYDKSEYANYAEVELEGTRPSEFPFNAESLVLPYHL